MSLGKSPNTPSKSGVCLKIKDKDTIKAILEYLENRGLHIAQLSLERETGIINGNYSDDLLFLRQLILDGQWDNALDFVEPLKSIKLFDFQLFRYYITKYKFFELLCVKLEPGPLHDNDFAVEELVECLKDLEHIAPSPEDYHQLCALLTLPALADHADFKSWNPSGARVECFHKVHDLVAHFLPPTTKEKQRRSMNDEDYASNDRLNSLIAKGRFYEGCVDYCQSQAVEDCEGIENGPMPSKLLSNRPKLGSTDLSLISWMEVIEKEQFAMPFKQKQLEVQTETIKKPRLEAAWTETIMSTPIKPGGHFPHTLVPKSRPRFAEKMSQSMSYSMMVGGGLMATDDDATLQLLQNHSKMSKSTAPGFCLGATVNNDDAMAQSLIIDEMLENSQKTSRPDTLRLQVNQQMEQLKQQQEKVEMVMMPSMSMSMRSHEFGPRKQLDEMTRRSMITSRAPTLPMVPELASPCGQQENLMTQSVLFRQFSANQQHKQPMYVAPTAIIQQPVVSMRPQSMPAPPQMPASHARPVSMPSSSAISPKFVPACRHEDTQAIRATGFHPSGRYFALGTNSKQLHVCRYPMNGRRSADGSADVVFTRAKQHRGSVYCLAFNKFGDLLATGSNDKTVRLMAFDEDSCRIGAEMELNSHDGTVRDLIFVDELLVSGGAGNCHINVTDTTCGQLAMSLRGHTAPILGLYSWASSSTQFVSCSQDKTIRLWDRRQPSAVSVISSPVTNRAPVTSVCVDPSGKLLVSGHEDASVVLFDIAGNRVIQTFRPHGDEVRTVRFSNAAYYLLSASYDKRVVITDMRGDLTSPLMYVPVAEHSDKVVQCRWHPSEFSFLSTSADRSAVLWTLPTFK